MKHFLIITIVCAIGVQAVWSKESKTSQDIRDPEVHNKVITECASEVDAPVYKSYGIYVALDFLSHIYPGRKTDKMTCMAACIQRKRAEVEGSTYLTFIKKNIDMIYEHGYGSLKVSAEELKSKADYCFIEAPNGCGFYKCLDYYKPPFSYIQSALLKPRVLETLRYGFH